MVGLRTQNLVVEYASGGNAIRPIDGLNLELDAGSLTILLGPSGCGKTTLLSCLGGLLTPTSGQITVGDVDVTALNRRAMTRYRRHNVGIVFQAFNLVPSLTALENVLVPLRAAGVSRSAARARAEELLTRVGLQDRMNHRPGDLSGGQQQRVAVARAIALDPPLILADEPTAHLDYLQVEEMLRLIRDLASGDRMVVVATHDSRLLPMADRVIEMAPTTTLVNRAHETIQLEAGTVLFNQGALADLIYVVSEGELELVRQRPGGGQQVLRVVQAGDHFGEIGPLFGLPRSATVRARTDAVVTGFSVPAFRQRLSAETGPGLNEGRELAMD
jgi:putative ABC transport system ATP-binding protein